LVSNWEHHAVFFGGASRLGGLISFELGDEQARSRSSAARMVIPAFQD
jgi:hypothetical protein